MKLTVLGTGVPVPDPHRRGASQVIEVGDSLIIVDCGRGAADRFVEAGFVAPDRRSLVRPLHTIALTHLHSDHVTGLADLLWAGWVMRWWQRPPILVGPPGTARMIHHLMEAFAYDIDVRTRGESSRREELVPRVIEVEDGWNNERDEWRLTSFRVDHAPVDQAFGFRIDTGSGSMVISGDTRYSENLIHYAQGVDILVHEVYSRLGMEQRRRLSSTEPRQQALVHTISSYHTPSNDVGKVAALADAKRLVLSHVLLGHGGTVDDILSDVTDDYGGPASVAADLQSFTT